MLKRNKTALVENPELDPAFSKLVSDRETCHARLDELDRAIATARGKLDEHASAGVAGVKVRHADAQKLADRLNADTAERETVRKRLRELCDQLPLSRQRAARAIADRHRATFNAGGRAFLVARLVRLGPEIVAAESTLRLSEQLEARRIARVGMFLPSSMTGARQEFQRLREDTEAALAAGVIKRADVPKELGVVWGIE